MKIKYYELDYRKYSVTKEEGVFPHLHYGIATYSEAFFSCYHSKHGQFLQIVWQPCKRCHKRETLTITSPFLTRKLLEFTQNSLKCLEYTGLEPFSLFE
jgi:hypothetical protein